MLTLFYRIIFLLFTIYVFINSVSYGLYEINEQKNKIGGRVVILFTIFSVIFSNVIVWLN